mmetsp:Transcript_6987/g.10297  ORF Transcript_6987/g.10297 Transcript_6987/m.10297 type:complete len:491 (-) Transcript_6987:426-1898(-)
MPKKLKSQRRKKGKSLGDSEHDDTGFGDVDEVEILSEDHTVADDASFNSFYDDFGGDAENGAAAEDGAPDTQSRAEISAANRHNSLLEALSLASTIPSEKRSVKREQYLKRLFKAISQFAAGPPGQEAVLSRVDDAILPACKAGLRAGSANPAEQYAACRVLEVTSVIIGHDQDDYVESIEQPLRLVIKGTHRAAVVRGAALRALAMTHFICGADESGTNSVLNLCEEVCAPQYRGEDVSPCLRAIALDCWALLSSTVADAYLAGDEMEEDLGRGLVILPLLSTCLNSSNMELRCAAGECVALIHESRLNLGIDEDEGENASERRFRRGSWDGSEWEVLMDEVKQRVAELSVESGRHMSKKAKKEQRATFRDFMATIVDDEPPVEVVNFRGGTVTLRTWREIIEINFVRHCLQGGFQIQLMTNETLHMIFDIDASTINDATGAALSQLEKRLTMSKTSEAAKAADLDMTRRRRTRTNVKNYFITADGEDI